MIHPSPYDTGAGASLPVGKIRDELPRVVSGQYLHRVDAGTSFTGYKIELFLLEGGNAIVDSIPYFDHPLEFGNNNICADVRLHGRFNPQTRRFVIRNADEYSFAIKRAALSKLWLEGCQIQLRDLSQIPAQLYSAMLSETIARRYTLDPSEQAFVAVYASYFYMSLFSDIEITGMSYDRMLINISKITYVKLETVRDLLNGLDQPKTIEDFIAILRERIANDSLLNLTYATLLQITCGLWMGAKARDISAVALEHPPTWMVMTEAAMKSKTYKFSSLSKMAMRFGRGNLDDVYSKGLNNIINGDKLRVALEGFILV